MLSTRLGILININSFKSPQNPCKVLFIPMLRNPPGQAQVTRPKAKEQSWGLSSGHPHFLRCCAVQSRWPGSQRKEGAADPYDPEPEPNLGSRPERQVGFEATCLEPSRGVTQRAPKLKHPLEVAGVATGTHFASPAPGAESVPGPQLLSVPPKRPNPQQRARVRNEPGPWRGGFAQRPRSGSLSRGDRLSLGNTSSAEPAPDGPGTPSSTTRRRSRTETRLRETTRGESPATI